jgi:hypothetical protein
LRKPATAATALAALTGLCAALTGVSPAAGLGRLRRVLTRGCLALGRSTLGKTQPCHRGARDDGGSDQSRICVHGF